MFGAPSCARYGFRSPISSLRRVGRTATTAAWRAGRCRRRPGRRLFRVGRIGEGVTTAIGRRFGSHSTLVESLAVGALAIVLLAVRAPFARDRLWAEDG